MAAELAGFDERAGTEEGAASAERAALFDLAVARADAYLRRARRPTSGAPADLRRALEPWALKTRFASRVDLDAVVRALAARPPDPDDPAAPRSRRDGGPVWRGGPSGAWR